MRIRAATALLTGALMVTLVAACSDDGEQTSPGFAPGNNSTGGPPAAPGPTSGTAPAAFNDDGARGTFDCAGQNVTINGHGADLHLTGSCAIVVINGERSTVVVDDAQMIVVNGENSAVTYSGEPEVVVNAENATAEPAD